jgi:hypothetical protein
MKTIAEAALQGDFGRHGDHTERAMAEEVSVEQQALSNWFLSLYFVDIFSCTRENARWGSP